MLVGKRVYTPQYGSVPRLDSDSWTIHVATNHASKPESRLKTDLLEDYTQAYGPRASQHYVHGTINQADEDREIGIVALLGTNRHVFKSILPVDAEQLPNRVRLRIDLSYPVADRVYVPVVSVSLTNLTGTIGDVNGAIDPPTTPLPVGYAMTRLAATSSSSNTVCTAVFANNNATERPLITAMGQQRFRVHAKWDDGHDSIPIVRLILRQSGTDVADLGLGSGNAVEKTSEGWMFTWISTGVALPSATGQVGVRIEGTTSGGRTPEIIGIEWYAAIDTTNMDYDSGWITLSNRKNYFWLPTDSGDNILSIPGDSQAYFLLELSDYVIETADLVTYTPVPVLVMSEVNGQSYAGRFVGCTSLPYDLLSPSGLNWRRSTDYSPVRSRGGGGMRSNRTFIVWKEADLVLPFIPNSDLLETWESFLDLIEFTRKPFILIPHPSRGECYWVICTSWDSDHVGYFVGDGDEDERYNLLFSVAEFQATIAKP